MCHECQSFLSSVPALWLPHYQASQGPTSSLFFLCQVFGSLKSLNAHHAPVREVMAEWIEALLLLWHCEDIASEVLPFPASTGSSQGRRNGGVLLLGMTEDLNLLKRIVYLLPPAGGTDPVLLAGLLTVHCILAVEKNPNKWIRKETAS